MPKPDAFDKISKGTVAAVREPTREPELDQLYTLADIDPVGRTEALIWGPPGTAKTVIAAGFPAPLRFLDADGGLKSVRWAFKEGLTQLESMEDLVAYRPKDHEGRHIANPEAFNKSLDMINHWFSNAEVDLWETLVLDSFTMMNIWAIDLGTHLNSQLPKVSKPLSRSREINLKAGIRMIIGQQDYKSAQALIEDAIDQIRIECTRHDKNLVITAHEWIETSETVLPNGQVARQIVGYKPALIGQLRERLVKDFDDVWAAKMYSKDGKPDPKIQMHKDSLRYAKTRWGSFMSYEEEPNYRKLIAKVRAYHAE